MLYKRTEYVRYTFGEPLEAKFQIAVTEGNIVPSGVGACSLIDLSPGGAKIATKFDLPYGQDSVQIHITFTLLETQLEAWGKIIWKRQYGGAHLYGIKFKEDLMKEQLIVDELKQFSRAKLEKKKR